jgi:hypothetical protein
MNQRRRKALKQGAAGTSWGARRAA